MRLAREMRLCKVMTCKQGYAPKMNLSPPCLTLSLWHGLSFSFNLPIIGSKEWLRMASGYYISAGQRPNKQWAHLPSLLTLQ